MSAMRKKRCDRNHVVYLIRNQVTSDTYIGITVCRGQAKVKSAKERFDQHVYNAVVRGSDTPLSQNIKKYGASVFTIEVIDVVRGKTLALTQEARWIQQMSPTLNVLKVQRFYAVVEMKEAKAKCNV